MSDAHPLARFEREAAARLVVADVLGTLDPKSLARHAYRFSAFSRSLTDWITAEMMARSNLNDQVAVRDAIRDAIRDALAEVRAVMPPPTTDKPAGDT